MKIKAACIGTPQEVVDALSGSEFASRVLSRVVGDALGVDDVLNRPAEYYVQKADVGPSAQEGVMGVEVRLTGVSRDGRSSRQFYFAIEVLSTIVKEVVAGALPIGKNCQIFAVIMIDGEIETAPGIGLFSNNLESNATWVIGTRTD